MSENYSVREFYAVRGENRIYCNAYIPHGAGKRPTVICCHGYGGNIDSCAGYAAALAHSGYLACCFDFCGGGMQSVSDGKMTEMSIFTEREDLLAVINAVIRQFDTADESRLFLLGESMGGAIAAITAAAHPESVKGLILLYPAFVLVDDIKAKFNSVSEIPDTFEQLGLTLGRVFAERLLDYDIYEEISAYNNNVLIIHGDADGLVPLSYSERAVSVYPRAGLKVISGGGHGFSGEHARSASGYILKFMEEKTKGKN